MEEKKDMEEIRLNRFLAQCGIASRRKADELIASGNIYLNGERVTELGAKVKPGVDKVEYRGKEIKPFHALQYIAYHKPRGVVVTRSDPEGRDTVYDVLREKGQDISHLNYVGRLDLMSEGLLLLTNDGDLIHALTHPRFGIKKTYKVKVDRKMSTEEVQKLISGVESEGVILHAGAIREIDEPSQIVQVWYEIDLYEGKNRQIRRMLEVLGIKVSRLRRVQFGSVKLGSLPSGESRSSD